MLVASATAWGTVTNMVSTGPSILIDATALPLNLTGAAPLFLRTSLSLLLQHLTSPRLRAAGSVPTKRVSGRLGRSKGTACLAQVSLGLPPPLGQARPAPSFPGGTIQPEEAAAAAVGKAHVRARRAAPTAQAAAGQHGTVLSVTQSPHCSPRERAASPVLYLGQGD